MFVKRLLYAPYDIGEYADVLGELLEGRILVCHAAVGRHLSVSAQKHYDSVYGAEREAQSPQFVFFEISALETKACYLLAQIMKIVEREIVVLFL